MASLKVFFPSASHARALIDRKYLGGQDIYAKGGGGEPQTKPGFRFDATLIPKVYAEVGKPLPSKPRVVAFASFSGAAARDIKEDLGASVLGTDVRDCKLDHAVRGVRFKQAAYHEIPTTRGTNFHFSFEPIPLTYQPSFYLGLLRSLAHTTHGLVLAHTGAQERAESFRSRSTVKQIMENLARAYGARYGAFTNGAWDVEAVIPTPEAKRQAGKDLRVIEELERAQLATGARSESKAVTVQKLATLLREKPDQVRARLQRISDIMIKHFDADKPPEETLEQSGDVQVEND